ncbi:hypothetical protein P7K49_021610, partial [Saguinus oedipus]
PTRKLEAADATGKPGEAPGGHGKVGGARAWLHPRHWEPGRARTCVYKCVGPLGVPDYKFQRAQRRSRVFWLLRPLAPS